MNINKLQGKGKNERAKRKVTLALHWAYTGLILGCLRRKWGAHGRFYYVVGGFFAGYRKGL